MGKKKRNDVLTLAEWCEHMSLIHLQHSRQADMTKQLRRSHAFKSKRLAQVATVLRGQDEILNRWDEIAASLVD